MWQLIINGPGYFDTTYELPEGVTTLGRADENDIVLSGDLVSRKHARITAQGDQLSVEDLGSRNGSRLNGESLTGTARLKTGDLLNVGENSVSIRQASTVESAATEMVNLSAGGVRRFGEGTDLAQAVVVARNVKDSVVLRALDNVSSFSNPFGEGSPAPVTESATSSEPLAYESLLVLYKAAEALATSGTLQHFFDQTVDRVMERVKATTAVVLLRHHSGAMVPACVRHRGKLAQGEVPVSDAVVAEALSKGVAIAVSDVRDDARFAQRESVLLYGVDQVLCIPLGQREPFAGVLYLNKQAKDDGPLEELLDLCGAVGHLLATGVARFKTEDRGRVEDRIRKLLEHYHPPEVVERRWQELTNDPTSLNRIDARQATVLVASLSGLSAMAQKADPAALQEILADFYQRMTGVVFSFEGTLDKFLGDTVVAVFGAPFQRGDDALRAVRTALTMRSDWHKSNRRRDAAHRPELQIGIHTGQVFAGMVGSEPRIEFTVVGDTVTTSNLLAASGQPGQVLISGKTLAAIGARFDVTPLGERALRGKERTAVFEVLEEDIPLHTNPGVR